MFVVDGQLKPVRKARFEEMQRLRQLGVYEKHSVVTLLALK